MVATDRQPNRASQLSALKWAVPAALVGGALAVLIPPVVPVVLTSAMIAAVCLSFLFRIAPAVVLLLLTVFVPYLFLGPAGISADDILPVLAGAAGALALIRPRRTPLSLPRSVLIFMGLWMACATLAIVVHTRGVMAGMALLFRGVGRPLLFLSCGVLAFFEARRSPLMARRIIATLAVIGGLEALLGIGFFMTRFTYPLPTRPGFVQVPGQIPFKIGIEPVGARYVIFGKIPGRLVGTVGTNANALAAFLVLSLAATLGLAWATPPSRRRNLWIASAALQAIALGLTYTRGAILGLIIGSAIVGFIVIRRLGVSTLKMAAIAGIMLAIVFAAVPDLWARITETSGLQGRQNLVMQGLRVIGEHPFFGVGAGHYVEALSQRLGLPVLQTPHNSFVLIAAESGIPAGAFALATVVCAIGSLFALLKRSSAPDLFLIAGTAAGAVGFLVQNASNNLLQTPPAPVYFWFLFGLMHGLSGVGSGQSVAQREPQQP